MKRSTSPCLRSIARWRSAGSRTRSSRCWTLERALSFDGFLDAIQSDGQPFKSATQLLGIASISQTQMRGRIEEPARHDGSSVLPHQPLRKGGGVADAANAWKDHRAG